VIMPAKEEHGCDYGSVTDVLHERIISSFFFNFSKQ